LPILHFANEKTSDTRFANSGNHTVIGFSIPALMYVAQGNGVYVTVDFTNYGNVKSIFTSFNTPTCVCLNRNFDTIMLGTIATYTEFNMSFANGYLNPTCKQCQLHWKFLYE